MRFAGQDLLKPMNDIMNDKVEVLKYYKFKKIIDFKKNNSLKMLEDMTF